MLKNQMLNRIFSEYKNNTWVYLAMSVAIAVLIVAWWVVSDSHPENDTHRVEENNAGRAVYPDMVPTDQDYEIDELKDTLRDLNETAQMLMDSITYLETKLIRAHVLSDTLIENGETLTVARVEPRTAQPASQPANASPAAPIENGETLTVARVEPRTAQPASQPATETTAAPAAGMAAEKQPESTEAPDAETEKVGKTSRQPPADAERQEPVSVASRTTAEKTQPAGAARDAEKTTEARTATPGPTQRQPESTTAAAVASPDAGQTGEWVINLASLRSPRQAENFKSKAGMKGFDTSIQQVTVKGRDYWRVQITGLATLDEANARGNAIKQRLGLKEVWISRQR